MLDFSRLDSYRENNRLEAKQASGGLPRSLWETYSAFANTLGGIILLGVTESADKSLTAVGVPNPDKLIQEFWNIVNNPKKVSLNILSDKDVCAQCIDGNTIVVINVPRADRSYRPVYLDGNPLNTYRRNGEGDYKCTKDEYQAMVRDAAVKTPDMLLLTALDLSVFNVESVRGYRQRMKLSRPGHVWEQLDDEIFLQKISAVGIGEDGRRHPTSAGLLMFGNECEIVREYNNYFLDYQEQYDPLNRWTDRIVSSSGDWSGNVYDFFFRVYSKLQQAIRTPFKLNGITRVEDTPVHQALREALANCLVNADYCGRQGVVVIKQPQQITLANPGTFRIDIAAAISGGVSDPRNSVLLKMFNFIDIGERAGSGVPNIFRVWQDQQWQEPAFVETHEPDRTTLHLPLAAINGADGLSAGDKSAINGADGLSAGDKSAIKVAGGLSVGDKSAINGADGLSVGDKSAINGAGGLSVGDKSAINGSANPDTKARIAAYLAVYAEATTAAIAEHVGLKSSRTRDYLKALVSEGVVEALGSNKNRAYRLKK